MPALILMYHRVTNLSRDPWGLAVTPTHFAEQLEVLSREVTVVPLSELRRDPPAGSRTHVALTFDDGYEDNFTEALPCLERQEMPATCFITTAAIGGRRELWWDELDALLLEPAHLPARLRLGIDGAMYEWTVPATGREGIFVEVWHLLQPLPPRRQAAILGALRSWAGILPPTARATHRILTSDQLVRFGSHPLISIGAHTENHPILPGMPLAPAAREIAGSRQALERLTGTAPVHFAYPYGAEDQATRALVRQAGFELACTTEEHLLTGLDDPMALPRFEVRDRDGEGFARDLAGWIGLKT